MVANPFGSEAERIRRDENAVVRSLVPPPRYEPSTQVCLAPDFCPGDGRWGLRAQHGPDSERGRSPGFHIPDARLRPVSALAGRPDLPPRRIPISHPAAG